MQVNVMEKIAVGSIKTTVANLKLNCERIVSCMNDSKKEGIECLFLPELCISGVNLKDLIYMPSFVDKCKEALLELQKSIPDSFILGVGLPLRSTLNITYNAYVIMNKDEILYIDLFDDSIAKNLFERINFIMSPLYERLSEKQRFKALSQIEIARCNVKSAKFEIDSKIHIAKRGDIIINILNKEVKLSLFGSRLNKCKGGDLVISPCTSYYSTSLKNVREYVQKSILNTYENVFSCNILGNENGNLIYDGLLTISKSGKTIHRNNLFSFKDYNFIHIKSEDNLQALSTYQIHTKAIALGLFDYMIKTRADGFALSLSGGADSALCATLVILSHVYALDELKQDYFALMKKLNINLDASLYKEDTNAFEYIKTYVAPKILVCAYQATNSSGSETYNIASTLAKELNCEFHNFNIANIVDSYTNLIKESLPNIEINWQTQDLALQNIQARTRLPSVWMLANIKNRLLITTSNMSEGIVGYCTMDGDTAGSLCPIGGLPKSYLLKLIEELATLGATLLSNTRCKIESLLPLVTKAPTAELRPTGEQTDEGDLMPYQLLDTIKTYVYDRHLPPVDVYNEIRELAQFTDIPNTKLKAYIKKFFVMCQRAQWKRERLAPAFYIFSRTDYSLSVLSSSFDDLIKDLDNFFVIDDIKD